MSNQNPSDTIRSRIAAILSVRGVTQSELADRLKIRPTSVHKLVKGKGVIKDATAERVAAALAVPVQFLKGTAVPVIGWVAAGNGEDDDVTGQYVNLPDFCRAADGVYRVRGTSMCDAGILPGDYLAVRTTQSPVSGELVIAWIRDCGSVVKRLRVDGGRMELHSETGTTDGRYPYAMRNGDRFYGVLISCFRRYDEPEPIPKKATPGKRRK